MRTLIVRAVVFLASAAIGLIAADLLLPGFRIVWPQWWGFLLCIVVFAVLQSLLSPLVAKLTDRYAPVLTGGIGIISTLIALVLVVLLPIGGLRITDAMGWLAGSVVVWLVTALATLLLPLVIRGRKKPAAQSRIA